MWIRRTNRMQIPNMWKSIFWIPKEYTAIKGETDTGEQRSIIAGGIGTSRGQPFGFGPRVKTAIDKSTLPEVILKMVFGHSSYHDWHFAAHHTVQPVTFPLYHFRKIFYVHNHQ
jgi:hypothetical protein